MSEPSLKIGDLAERLKVPVETIRYYEKEGLLPAPRRTEGNYRVYDTAHVDRLAFIRNCRALDMTLDEVRELLRLRDAPDEECVGVNLLVDEHIQHVQDRIADLRKLESTLTALRHRCGSNRSAGECGILETLTTATVPTATSHGSHAPAAKRHSPKRS
ncbi:Cd(II)/Pb(II)-responsive transcriptional regulator [Hydrocarboniphaga effusa]|jgi:Cd(II)/Pb(II)-responsive transcriptional regulator|uniref:Cd(II)/Pb(II)-responsive transcriptional regulator n=1 Tax=Hydrocarboniphaga effusa TaxID=243629 RepID=UPI003137C2F7